MKIFLLLAGLMLAPQPCGEALAQRNDVQHQRQAASKPSPATDSGLRKKNLEVSVLDQDGKHLKFYTDLIHKKTVAINFIFTSCTNICPPLTATFRRVQQILREQGRDVQLISISVDPTIDVPERLKDYARKFKAEPGWTFVTGEKSEIDRLLTALGTYVKDKNDHTPMILIGNDQADYWTRTYGLAPASSLAKILGDAAERKALH